MTFRVDTAALEDADTAAAWYESRRPRLAHEFLEEFQCTLDKIQSSPLSFSSLEYPEDMSKHVRHTLMKRFPYIVIFATIRDQTTVVAVEHTSRRPGLWSERLEDSPE